MSYELTSLWLPAKGEDLGKPHPAVLPSLGKIHRRAQGHTPCNPQAPTDGKSQTPRHTHTPLLVMRPSRHTDVCVCRGGTRAEMDRRPCRPGAKAGPEATHKHARTQCTYTQTGKINKDTFRSYTPRGTDRHMRTPQAPSKAYTDDLKPQHTPSQKEA